MKSNRKKIVQGGLLTPEKGREFHKNGVLTKKKKNKTKKLEIRMH